MTDMTEAMRAAFQKEIKSQTNVDASGYWNGRDYSGYWSMQKSWEAFQRAWQAALASRTVPEDVRVNAAKKPDGSLYDFSWYLDYDSGSSHATLDGNFTALQLQAIADVMIAAAPAADREGA